MHALLPTIGSFTAVAGVVGGLIIGSPFQFLAGLHSGVSSLLYLSQQTVARTDEDGKENQKAELVAKEKKEKKEEERTAKSLIVVPLVEHTLEDLSVALAICGRAFDAEYLQRKKEVQQQAKEEAKEEVKKEVKDSAESTSTSKPCSGGEMTAEALALEREHVLRLRDSIWHATLVWVTAEEVLLHWVNGYTTEEGTGMRLLVAASKLLAMWAQHSVLQLLRQREVVLWLVGAENALVGALSAIGAAISWSVARHSEQMPLWLDRLLPRPMAVCVILAIRRHAVALGLGLGFLKSLSPMVDNGPAVLGCGMAAALVLVGWQASSIWASHKLELGDESNSNSEKAVYDGRLRMLLPSVSQAAEKALMATVAKVKAMPQTAALNTVKGAVQAMAVSSMQTYAQGYVAGKMKGE